MEHMDSVPYNTRGTRKTDWDAVVKEVRQNGGRWARVGLFSPSVASWIRQGRYPAVDPDEFIVTTRKDPETKNKSWLYMKVRPK